MTKVDLIIIISTLLTVGLLILASVFIKSIKNFLINI